MPRRQWHADRRIRIAGPICPLLSANLTVAGIGERAGVPFRFLEFAKVAFPLMLISIAISHVYLEWRFL